MQILLDDDTYFVHIYIYIHTVLYHRNIFNPIYFYIEIIYIEIALNRIILHKFIFIYKKYFLNINIFTEKLFYIKHIYIQISK